jgi:hypothetical protein
MKCPCCPNKLTPQPTTGDFYQCVRLHKWQFRVQSGKKVLVLVSGQDGDCPIGKEADWEDEETTTEP